MTCEIAIRLVNDFPITGTLLFAAGALFGILLGRALESRGDS